MYGAKHCKWCMPEKKNKKDMTLMVGWQEGYLDCEKPLPLIIRGYLLGQVEEQDLTETG